MQSASVPQQYLCLGSPGTHTVRACRPRTEAEHQVVREAIGCVEGLAPSTCAFGHREDWGYRVWEVPAAQERLPGRAEGSSYLSGVVGSVARGGEESAGQKPQGPVGNARSVPLIARPGPAAHPPQPHPDPPPTARGGQHSEGGDLRKWRGPPLCPGRRILSCLCPAGPLGTGNPPGNARGPPGPAGRGTDPANAHTPLARRWDSGFKGEPAVS